MILSLVVYFCSLRDLLLKYRGNFFKSAVSVCIALAFIFRDLVLFSLCGTFTAFALCHVFSLPFTTYRVLIMIALFMVFKDVLSVVL